MIIQIVEMSRNQLPPVQRQSINEATAEAEARPLEYNPNERAKYVRLHLQDIALWMSHGDSEETIRQRVPEFIENYPELFKKIIEKQDLSPIQSMLAMLDRMGEGRLTQHQASVIIGQKLVDRYVTPQLKGNGSK
jgi:hypothetical protein